MAIYTVKRTPAGYQPMRNEAPHFEAFPDYLSAFIACKAADARQERRLLRVASGRQSEAA